MSLAETLAAVQVLSLEQCRLYHTSLPFSCTLTHPSAFCELWEVPSTLLISLCKSSTCILTLAGHEDKVCVFIFGGNSMTGLDSPLQCVGIEEIIQRGSWAHWQTDSCLQMNAPCWWKPSRGACLFWKHTSKSDQLVWITLVPWAVTSVPQLCGKDLNPGLWNTQCILCLSSYPRWHGCGAARCHRNWAGLLKPLKMRFSFPAQQKDTRLHNNMPTSRILNFC